MQLAQYRPGLGADLVHQDAAGALICGQGLGLPAGAVQREHEGGVQLFAVPVLDNEVGELSDQLSGSPERQLQFEPFLDRL